MLNKLSEQVREGLDHAEDCARLAAAQPDGSTLKMDYLFLERNWRSLARSFQTSERLDDFINEPFGRASATITPFLLGQAFDPETIEAMGKALIGARRTLGLSDRDDAMTQLVAQKIIELAQRGLKTRTKLYLVAIKEFMADSQ